MPRVRVAGGDALRVALRGLAVLRAALDALVIREGPDAIGRLLQRRAAQVALVDEGALGLGFGFGLGLGLGLGFGFGLGLGLGLGLKRVRARVRVLLPAC